MFLELFACAAAPDAQSLDHSYLIILCCRSYRLSITAVSNLAAANSVQLAQLNLYTTLATPQPPSEALSGAIANLHAAANHSDSALAETYAKTVETLLLVLVNVLQHPEEAKYRTLKSSNARVQSMLSCGDCFEEILKAVGKPPTAVAVLFVTQGIH